MQPITTAVTFNTSNQALQRLYRAAENKLRNNIEDFAGHRVLIEGARISKNLA